MEKKDNKIYLIIIAILLLVVGICLGYIFGTKTKEVSSNTTNNNSTKENKKTEDKTTITKDTKTKETSTNTSNNTPKENTTIEEKPISEKQVKGILKSEGTNESISISLNGKSKDLILEKNTNKDSIFKYGDTKLCFIQGWGTGPSYDCAPDEADYAVVKGTDSKEYLVVYYQSSFDKYLLVLNDQTEIIGKFSSRVELGVYDCFATLQDENAPIYNIEGNTVYYYKNTTTEHTTNAIDLELTKLEISNNSVKEIKTNQTATGKYVQCT